MEGGLQRIEPAAFGETLDGHDRAALDLRRGDEAGADLRAVEQHRAGAAIAGIAADLGAGQPQILTQEVGEPADGGRHHCFFPPVHPEMELKMAVIHPIDAPARPSSSREISVLHESSR